MIKPDLDYTLIEKVYANLTRQSIYNWVKKGCELDEFAKRGIAISPSYIEEIIAQVNPKRFDDLSKMPPGKLVMAEKVWFKLAYSTPGGAIIDPRPRAGALKGVYYDENDQRWYPRPFVKLPG